jgi:hypothetical protein
LQNNLRSSFSFQTKNAFFVNIFEKFILDQQKYVRSSAIEVFGKFISLLQVNECFNRFFEFYKNTLEEIYFNFKEYGIETETNFYNNVLVI